MNVTHIVTGAGAYIGRTFDSSISNYFAFEHNDFTSFFGCIHIDEVGLFLVI